MISVSGTFYTGERLFLISSFSQYSSLSFVIRVLYMDIKDIIKISIYIYDLAHVRNCWRDTIFSHKWVLVAIGSFYLVLGGEHMKDDYVF